MVVYLQEQKTGGRWRVSFGTVVVQLRKWVRKANLQEQGRAVLWPYRDGIRLASLALQTGRRAHAAPLMLILQVNLFLMACSYLLFFFLPLQNRAGYNLAIRDLLCTLFEAPFLTCALCIHHFSSCRLCFLLGDRGRSKDSSDCDVDEDTFVGVRASDLPTGIDFSGGGVRASVFPVGMALGCCAAVVCAVLVGIGLAGSGVLAGVALAGILRFWVS